jgi:hypothetical protein
LARDCVGSTISNSCANQLELFTQALGILTAAPSGTSCAVDSSDQSLLLAARCSLLIELLQVRSVVKAMHLRNVV